MPGHFEIYFERSGGFLGNTISIEIDSRSLSPEEKGKLESMIEESGFMSLQPPDKTVQRSPDRFQYQITIKSNSGTNTLIMGESSVPGELRSLIQYLTKKTRTRKK